MLGRFVQPDTIIPGGPQGLNRYSYVANNPVNFNDPTGHRPCGDGELFDCDGKKQDPNVDPYSPPLGHDDDEKDKGDKCTYHLCSEDTNLYELGWENFGQAWSIYTDPNASYGQKYGAGVYLGAWGGAHAMFTVGIAGLTCAAFGACLVTVEGFLGIGGTANAACGGDMCASEAIAVPQSFQQAIDVAKQSGQQITVLGRFKQGLPQFARQVGGDYLQVNPYHWGRNVKYIADALRNGNLIVTRPDVNLANADITSIFYREIQLLGKLDYGFVEGILQKVK